jgi:replicative DNA helicase
MDRYEAVSEVSRSIKEIAKENGLAVLALAQLSREVEKRPDKRPQLSDLRESGQIEQDADAVIFLLRPEYYLQALEPQPSSPEHVEWQRQLDQVAGALEIICAKRRNGRTGTAVVRFHSNYQAVRG